MAFPEQLLCPAESVTVPVPEVARLPGAVLFVEDEPTLAVLMRHLLGRLGRPVMHAEDGTAAVQLLSAHRDAIALVIVDCHLPDTCGDELSQMLRTLVPGVPLMLTSGRDQRALVARLATGGPTDFLAKPYLPGEVVRRVGALLARAYSRGS
jgi:DNA-binding response OmpR family regulator